MTTALVLHHDARSTPGIVGDALRARGVELIEHTICPDPGSPRSKAPLPALDGCDLLVLTGSRWSVYDLDNIGCWITEELELVREADRRHIATLGLCFGGQVLAAAHGGCVTPSDRPEVGWYQIESTRPDQIAAGPWFEWHFDRFDPPPASSVLARTDDAVQAFALGPHLGLQFHPELDVELLQLWLVDDADELTDAGVDVDALLTETRSRQDLARPNTDTLVQWWLDGLG